MADLLVQKKISNKEMLKRTWKYISKEKKAFIISILLAIIAMGIDLTNLAFIAGALSVGIGFGLQEDIDSRIRLVNGRIAGIPAVFAETHLIAVIILIALVIAHRFGDVQTVIILVPLIEAAACGKGRLTGDRAEQDVLAVERIVIPKGVDTLDILADHVADAQCIRILVNADVEIGLGLRFCMLILDLDVCCADFGVLALLEDILVFVALVKDILDAEDTVCKRRIAVISREVGAGRITHCLDIGQDLRIHDRAGMRDAAELEACVIVDRSDIGLFGTVEARIGFIQAVYHISAGLDVFAVGFSCGIGNFLVDILEFAASVIHKLDTGDRQQADHNCRRQSL